MFMFKKIVSQFLFPLPLSMSFLVVGLMFVWFTKKQYTGRIIISIGVFFLFCFSYGVIANRLLYPLEVKYAPYHVNASNESRGSYERIEYVVVLSGGHIPDPELPVSSRLESSSLMRVIEGIRVQKLHPESKLLLSGGRVFSSVPIAQTMADVAIAIGVDPSVIELELESKDTKDQARIIKDIVQDKSFILVTSASHMPRSMAMFRTLGMDPIAAPTAYRVNRHRRIDIFSLFPRVGYLGISQRAVYEYLGIAWAYLRGQID